MSDFNEGRHPLSPRSNSKVVPPYIPPPRKESLEAENARLKAECQARQAENSVLAVECDSLKADIERLTKAVMHSPAAQLKLKELEGKTTFEEINPDSK